MHITDDHALYTVFFQRFLAAQFGLKGKNNLESAQVDEVVDTIEDVIGVTIKTHFETDPVKKSRDCCSTKHVHCPPHVDQYREAPCVQRWTVPRGQCSVPGRHPPLLLLL